MHRELGHFSNRASSDDSTAFRSCKASPPPVKPRLERCVLASRARLTRWHCACNEARRSCYWCLDPGRRGIEANRYARVGVATVRSIAMLRAALPPDDNGDRETAGTPRQCPPAPASTPRPSSTVREDQTKGQCMPIRPPERPDTPARAISPAPTLFANPAWRPIVRHALVSQCAGAIVTASKRGSGVEGTRGRGDEPSRDAGAGVIDGVASRAR